MNQDETITKTGDQICQVCGQPWPEAGPLGHCPNCLLNLSSELLENLRSGGGEATRCGDYELLEEIGRGGMGVVYRARQISLNRMVAVKKLDSNSAAFPLFAQRLRFEAEAAASLNHPHIVRVYEAGEHDGQPFFSMELIEGTGMNRCISRQGVCAKAISLPPEIKRRGPQAKAAQLLAKIARAVDYAHQHGVLHRDLKPANVVIDSAGEPHLTDFGLAKILGPDQALISDTATVKGTAAFMAPEQASGKKQRISIAADVYGLGAILYNLLTGRAPFRGDSPLDTLRQVVEDQPPHPTTLNADIDGDLATICLKCLEKEPKQRYHSARALAEDLEHWLHHEPIEARPVNSLGRVWRWCRREPVLAGLVIGLFVFITASALLTAVLYQNERSTRVATADRIARDLRRVLDEMHQKKEEGGRTLSLSAEEVEILMQRELLTDGSEKRIILASRVSPGLPTRLVLPFVDLTHYLRIQLSSRARLATLFDLKLYRSHTDILAGLLEGKFHFARLDPVIYVLARRKRPGLVPIARQTFANTTDIRGAIIAWTSSGITTLNELREHTFAFGDRQSALGWYLPRAALVEAGYRSDDFTQIVTNLSNLDAMNVVRKGDADAGVAPLVEVERLIQAGAPLRVIHELSCPGDLWLVTEELKDAKFADALREALLALNDRIILAGLDPQLSSYSPAKPSDYGFLEQQMEKAERFDQP